ncbi:hypothetical protein CDL12_09281 [Handroanthus impetiginosus]|uniref:Bifunctional inhibitor/plant lipid transfer protein/seed storage helical domain-containing protein n=1 Tax=Handroanthus impetiginosus TaxID=429701 RepID=A0A2G9HKK7_9LAMI|nr:hypothetical protein CDL12_09281 [Handroanthus impetiginosus]
MVSKTSRKGSLFLAMNLICYILASGQQPATCLIDAVRLGVCANLLGGLVGGVVGNPPTTPCCTLLAGLVDLEAAVCLCTAINGLGTSLNNQLALSLLLNVCGRTPPPGFICA